jgi:hypothetical protein
MFWFESDFGFIGSKMQRGRLVGISEGREWGGVMEMSEGSARSFGAQFARDRGKIAGFGEERCCVSGFGLNVTGLAWGGFFLLPTGSGC